MNLKGFINKINKIESSINTSELRYKDFNYWPIIRNRLGISEYQKQNKGLKSSLNNISPFKRLINSFFHNLTNPKISKDTIVLSNAAYLVKSNNKYFDKFSDSIHEYFKEGIDVIQSN